MIGRDIHRDAAQKLLEKIRAEYTRLRAREFAQRPEVPTHAVAEQWAMDADEQDEVMEFLRRLLAELPADTVVVRGEDPPILTPSEELRAACRARTEDIKRTARTPLPGVKD